MNCTHTLTFWARRPTEPELLRHSHRVTDAEAAEMTGMTNLQEVADHVNAKYKVGACVIAQMSLIREPFNPEVAKAEEKYDRAKSNPNRRDWWAVKPS